MNRFRYRRFKAGVSVDKGGERSLSVEGDGDRKGMVLKKKEESSELNF